MIHRIQLLPGQTLRRPETFPAAFTHLLSPVLLLLGMLQPPSATRRSRVRVDRVFLVVGRLTSGLPPRQGHRQGRSPCLKGAKPGSGLCLLDHLVRTGEKGCRNLDTEQFRCLEIDGKQEFGGLLRHWKFAG